MAVATLRSFFVTAVVLTAVMVDHRAITFRTLGGRGYKAADRRRLCIKLARQ